MEKIFFNQLAIEITRRCQLKCAHCLRGEAQDLDIANNDTLILGATSLDAEFPLYDGM